MEQFSENENSIDSDDQDDSCQPPTAFQVEQSQPDEHKLKWLMVPRELYGGLLYPGNPFDQVGSSAKCGLCHYRRRTFYCKRCINKGEFVHSNQCRPEEFSEKRLKEIEIDRQASLLKNEILKRTSEQVKRMEILEQLSCQKQRNKHLRSILDNANNKLKQTDDHTAKLSSVNVKRHNRIPQFIDKVERIREISKESWRNIEVKRFETVLKLKELAHLRRNHAEELFKHIFPIVPDHTVAKDSTQLDYPVPDANNPPNLRHFLQDAMESNDEEGLLGSAWDSGETVTNVHVVTSDSSNNDKMISSSSFIQESPDMSEIEGEIVEAMGTSYVHGRWITAKWASSRNLHYHKIISAVVAAMNENPTFPVIAEGASETDRSENQTTLAALTFCTQLVNLLSACFDSPLPKKVSLTEFGITLTKTEYKFYKLVTRLNLNVLYLCLTQGVDPDLLKPRQFVSNLYCLSEHIKKDDVSYLGQSYKATIHIDLMFRMSEELAQDLNRIAQNLENPDSEDESENDEFKDWEAVSSSNSGFFPNHNEGYPIINPASMASFSQQSGIGQASAIVSSFFRGFSS